MVGHENYFRWKYNTHGGTDTVVERGLIPQQGSGLNEEYHQHMFKDFSGANKGQSAPVTEAPPPALGAIVEPKEIPSTAADKP
jgi:hypothetical protein